MNRVVVTGLGIVSSIGNGVPQVLQSLRESRSGMVFMPEMKKLGYRCCVFAPVKELDTSSVPRRALRTMSPAATYAAVATFEALQDAQLSPQDVANERASIVVGTGLAGVNEVPRAEQITAAHLLASRLGAAGLIKIMNSTAVANLAACLGVQGRTCSLSAACATGLYNIGHAYQLLKHGVQQISICGSTEEDTWRQVGLSADNSDGMPTDFNDRPTKACRPYDRDRQGFVVSAGSGIMILEALQHATTRGAKIYAEIIGYGAANDSHDMFLPSGEGLKTSIRQAMRSASKRGVQNIDYINSHGTGTTGGDKIEVDVIKEIFGQGPLVSSTKGISGHAQGATGSQEAVYTTLMLHHNFVAPTVNLDNVAPECAGIRHVQAVYEGKLETVMTITSGLGGANACLILAKL